MAWGPPPSHLRSLQHPAPPAWYMEGPQQMFLKWVIERMEGQKHNMTVMAGSRGKVSSPFLATLKWATVRTRFGNDRLCILCFILRNQHHRARWQLR